MMRPLTCPKCYEYAVQEQEVRVDLSAVVELDEVVALQARRVTRVGGVVRSDVVDAAAGGEGYAAVEGGGVRPEQAARLVLDPLADVRHEVALLQRGLHPLSRHAVALSRPPRLLHQVLEAHGALQLLLLHVAASVTVLPVVPAHERNETGVGEAAATSGRRFGGARVCTP